MRQDRIFRPGTFDASITRTRGTVTLQLFFRWAMETPSGASWPEIAVHRR
jgi:hypothetical protein